MSSTMHIILTSLLTRKVPITILRGHSLLWGADPYKMSGVTNSVFSHTSTPTVGLCRNRRMLRLALERNGVPMKFGSAITSQLLWFRGALIHSDAESSSDDDIALARRALDAVPGLTTGTTSISVDPQSGKRVISSVSPRFDLADLKNTSSAELRTIADFVIDIDEGKTPASNPPWNSPVELAVDIVGGNPAEASSAVKKLGKRLQVKRLGGFQINGRHLTGLTGKPENVSKLLVTLSSKDSLDVPVSAVFVRP